MQFQQFRKCTYFLLGVFFSLCLRSFLLSPAGPIVVKSNAFMDSSVKGSSLLTLLLVVLMKLSLKTFLFSVAVIKSDLSTFLASSKIVSFVMKLSLSFLVSTWFVSQNPLICSSYYKPHRNNYNIFKRQVLKSPWIHLFIHLKITLMSGTLHTWRYWLHTNSCFVLLKARVYMEELCPQIVIKFISLGTPQKTGYFMTSYKIHLTTTHPT